ncbi:MAG: sugar transferase [Cyanothece sp. SIO2G6]|nr:sugar transferase [Cyanothece sp. SIO2G6]
MIDGIYTLANDVVYDQAIALLNSIEANCDRDLPICVIAYNDNVERLQAEIDRRPQVTLMNDPAIFGRWEELSRRVWNTHPHALETWKEKKGLDGVYRIECNHRYGAFDLAAPFDRFIYLDADTLVLDSLDIFFSSLDHHDVVVYDFQHKDPSHIFNVNSPKLHDVFPPGRIGSEIFCSGCFASKKGLFSPDRQNWLIDRLAEGEAEVLYLGAPNQSVLNYMIMRSQIPVFNIALEMPSAQVTGNSVSSPHFEEKDNLLYDHGKRLTYVHYIGLSAKLFTQLSEGGNIDFPYRETFLHYRFLHEPENRPKLSGRAKAYNAPPSLQKRLMKKLGLA